MIGNSLDAFLRIEAPEEDFEFLKENKELMRKVLIVSQLDVVKGKELNFKVEHARGENAKDVGNILSK